MGKFKGTFGSIPESSISSSGVSIRLTLPPGPGQRAADGCAPCPVFRQAFRDRGRTGYHLLMTSRRRLLECIGLALCAAATGTGALAAQPRHRVGILLAGSPSTLGHFVATFKQAMASSWSSTATRPPRSG